MILDIVQIGNSQGIRIPKSILEECGINKKIDLEVKNNTITIKKECREIYAPFFIIWRPLAYKGVVVFL